MEVMFQVIIVLGQMLIDTIIILIAVVRFIMTLIILQDAIIALVGTRQVGMIVDIGVGIGIIGNS